MSRHSLSGVYAAAITPLDRDFSPDLEAIPTYLQFLAQRGCHGALLLGTTGEGPSFSPGERQEILEAGMRVRQTQPGFHMLAGTGTPSLQETIELTRAAFELGYDGVVVLPPYYYRKAPEQGLFKWYDELLRAAVPEGGCLFGYHIPGVSGVPLPISLLERLADAHPGKFAGLKDSSGDAEHARQLGSRFRDELLVLTGNDRLFSLALENHASGCITALANLASPELRGVWEAFIAGGSDPAAQQRLNSLRDIMDNYSPAPTLLKALLVHLHDMPRWQVKPPLQPVIAEHEHAALSSFNSIYKHTVEAN